MTFTKAITVKKVPPFDFELSAQIFRSGDPQIRTFSDGVFSQALRINDKLVLVKLKSKETVEAPTVRVEVKSNSQINPTDAKQLQEAVKFIFNLNFPLQNFYEEIKNDPIMSRIAQQLYGLKNPTTPTVFEALVDSIVEQQISIKVAHTIEERMIKKFGETLTIDSQTYYAYPTPQNVSNKSLSEVQSCGLSQRKGRVHLGNCQTDHR
jgi:DNA-3-methyladenine glycosylase II